jgi:hypothetical protein
MMAELRKTSFQSIPDNENELLLGESPTAANSNRKSTQSMTAQKQRKSILPTILHALVIISLIVALVWVKIDNDSKFRALNKEIVELRGQVEAVGNSNQGKIQTLEERLADEESKLAHAQIDNAFKFDMFQMKLQQQNSSSFDNYKNINSHITDHEKTLNKLMNGTSNAEVLDKLQKTKQQVNEELQKTQLHIHENLHEFSSNISHQLTRNEQTLQLTQKNMSNYVSETVNNMRNVVSLATNQIFTVQHNVTSQMTDMKTAVTVVMAEVVESVQTAQEDIQSEVKEVRDNIAQYVLITNKQFAAENDFVKYQLAGNIY